MICPTCERKNRTKARFCDNCGGQLPTPPRAAAKPTSVRVEGTVRGPITVDNRRTIIRGDAAPSYPSLLKAYLHAVVRDCAPLRLKSIDQGAAGPGREPLGLASIYIDLNLDWRIGEKVSLASILSNSPPSSPAATNAVSEKEHQRPVPMLEALAAFPKFVLLGGPGSGKSTVGAYVALSLAETRLGRKAAIKRLGKWWKLGPLIPIRIALRQFAASLPPRISRGRAIHLKEFLAKELTESGLDAKTMAALENAAAKDGALFFLDGLDETRDTAARLRVAEAIAEFMGQAGRQSRFLLTSRPYAWEEILQLAEDKTVSAQEREACQGLLTALPYRQRLADFDPSQTKKFIDGWYRAIQELGWISAPDSIAKAPELQAAVERDDLRPLARNPLLVTLMATLHSNRARLPDDRADLYNEVVELLLQRWNETVGADRGLLDALAIPSLKLSDLREALEHLAFRVHEAAAGQEGTADIPEGDLVAALKPLLGGSADKATLVVHYIENRAGLLIGHGSWSKQKQFSFPHRTFQEFLAGRHLASLPNYEDEVVRLAELRPSHWREVLRFAARLATAPRGVPASDILVNHENVEGWKARHSAGDLDWRKAVLAAEQLLEIGLAAVNSRPQHRVVRDRVTDWLISLVEGGHLPPRERAAAGNVLARLGDPRKGIAPVSIDDLDQMEFSYVPAGDVWAGNPGRFTRLDYGFWIGRHPVTVAQYDLFIKAGIYNDPTYWDQARKNSIWKDGHLKSVDRKEWRNAPLEYGRLSTYLNRPVGGVCWYEARAFSLWLANLWQPKLPIGWAVRLPSQLEWTKAARGGSQIPVHAIKTIAANVRSMPTVSLAPNPDPKRTYPWIGEFEPNKLNCRESEIGATSSVGSFPDAASPYGVLDLAGNVWEWCDKIHRDQAQLRGASCAEKGADASCDRPLVGAPYLSGYDAGFRIAITPANSKQ